MRHQNRTLVEKLVNKHGPFKKVLEVGSRSVDGGKIKDLFGEAEYIGLDMEKGENVDVVVNAHEMTYNEEFDLVVCLDTLEHDKAFWKTVENMRNAVKPGGFLCIAVPSRMCPEHNWPGDYWRFMPQAIAQFLEGYEEVFVETQCDNDPGREDEVAGWGRKPI